MTTSQTRFCFRKFNSFLFSVDPHFFMRRVNLLYKFVLCAKHCLRIHADLPVDIYSNVTHNLARRFMTTPEDVRY